MIPIVTSNDNVLFLLKDDTIIQSLKHLRTFTRVNQSKQHKGTQYPPTHRESWKGEKFVRMPARNPGMER